MKNFLFFICFCCSLIFCTNISFSKDKFIPPIKGVEWWETEEECVNAKIFIYYIPRTSSSAEPKGLISGGLPHRACIQMPLPEIKKKDGWVRQAEGDPYYFFEKKENGPPVPALRSECKNKVISFVYLPDLKGEKGDKGEPGISVKGDTGDPGISIKGDKGDPGEPGHIEKPVSTAAITPPKKGHKKLIAILAGAGVAIGTTALILALKGHEQITTTPVPPYKDPVTIIRSGP
jgi:hypothetical protein